MFRLRHQEHHGYHRHHGFVVIKNIIDITEITFRESTGSVLKRHHGNFRHCGKPIVHITDITAIKVITDITANKVITDIAAIKVVTVFKIIVEIIVIATSL